MHQGNIPRLNKGLTARILAFHLPHVHILLGHLAGNIAIPSRILVKAFEDKLPPPVEYHQMVFFHMVDYARFEYPVFLDG